MIMTLSLYSQTAGSIFRFITSIIIRFTELLYISQCPEYSHVNINLNGQIDSRLPSAVIVYKKCAKITDIDWFSPWWGSVQRRVRNGRVKARLQNTRTSLQGLKSLNNLHVWGIMDPRLGLFPFKL